MKSKLELRDFKEDDLQWFLKVRNSARQYLHNPQKFSLAQARAWYPSNAKNYRIILNFGEPIGYFRIGKISHSSSGQALLEIGADLSIENHGSGFAYRAYKKFLPKLRREFAVKGFVLQVLPTNIRAINLYIKLGFTISKLYSSKFDERSISNLELIYIPARFPRILRPRRRLRVQLENQ